MICMLGNFHFFLLSADFFTITFLEKFFHEYHLGVNSLDSHQARHYVKPDLGPNCLQRQLVLVYEFLMDIKL